MAISNVPYVNPTRRRDGEQSDGLAWLPVGVLDVTGWTSGDIGYAYTVEVYAGPESWADGSDCVLRVRRQMAPWRIRNALRRVKAAFLAVTASIQAEAAAEVGGQYLADPAGAWLDEPMETDPEAES